MGEETVIDLERVLLCEAPEWEAVEEIINGVLTDKDMRKQLEEQAHTWRGAIESGETDATLMGAFGIARYALGGLEEACEVLAGGRHTKVPTYVHALALKQRGDLTAARAMLQRVVAMSATFIPAHKNLLEVRCLLGDDADLADDIKELASKCQRDPDIPYLRALSQETQGNYEEAMKQYKALLKRRKGHVRCRFRLAYCQDLSGDDESAIENYLRLCEGDHSHVGALVNLGVLYEDAGSYEDAVACFAKVLKQDPTNARARLFLKDARASMDMYYDEELEKKADRRNRVLEIPITDFELSVRSRNCLERIGIVNLGDLTKVTEPQLLAHKNFGETSLNEIKYMMSQKGLRLGQAVPDVEGESPDGESVLADVAVSFLQKAVDDLELSVRARACMSVLGVATVADLVAHTEKQLLDAKNFGQTSLEEVKKRLAAHGLALKEPVEE